MRRWPSRLVAALVARAGLWVALTGAAQAVAIRPTMETPAAQAPSVGK